MLWKLYNSNILTARFWVNDETGDIDFSVLDPLAGIFSPKKVLEPADTDSLKARLGFDAAALLAEEPAYSKALGGKPEGDIALENGAWYTARGDGLYAQRQVVAPMDVLVAGGGVVAFLWPLRDTLKILVRDGFEDSTVLCEWDGFDSEELYAVEALATQMVPMRDGVRLATDVYLPKGAPQPLPAILVRTPYGIQNNREAYYRYVQRGYAVVLQDTRGREASEGEFIPCHGETEDGDDTLTWVAAQSWSDGGVGMMGASYLGYVQWAAAASGNPHLKAMISEVTAGSPFADIPRRGGCFTSGMLAWSFAMSEQHMRADLLARDDWDEVLDIRPLADIPQKALGHEIPFLTKWLAHRDEDDFWRRGNWYARMKEARHDPVPTLLISGWFDDNGMGSTEALDILRDWPQGTHKAILGPWVHSFNSRYDIHNIPVGEQALRYDIDLTILRWLDRFLKQTPNGIENTPAVEYYTLGQNHWKTAEGWPLPNAAEKALYLAENCTLANDPGADGTIGYQYDPANPATHIIDMSENELEVPEDYTEEEKRPDVLCFTTPPLADTITVTGDVAVELYVSSDAPDTDFVVRVTVVDAAGRSIKLADGMLCAKYRNSFATPEYMQAGEVYKLCIRTTKLSNTFPKGSRLRFTVTSSAKNFTFPNSNTCEGYDGTEIAIATNTIHFGKATPSRILLPVEP